MLYRIHIDQRLDRRKAVIEAVKELASDFTIFTGMAYFNGNRRPCQVIEINHEGLWPDGVFKSCVDKLKKILNMPHILVTETKIEQVVY